MSLKPESKINNPLRLILMTDTSISSYVRSHIDEILEEWQISCFESDVDPTDLASAKRTMTRIFDAYGSKIESDPFHGLDVAIEDRIQWISSVRSIAIKHWSESRRSFTGEDVAMTAKFHAWIDQCILDLLSESKRLREEQVDLARELIGHDLMTPISAMMLSAQCIQMTKGDPATTQDASQAMVRSGNLVAQIVNEASQILAWDGRLKIRRNCGMPG